MRSGRSCRLASTIGISAAFSLIAGAAGQTIVQGPVINPANGHTYYRLSNSTWSQAEGFAMANGGHLVSINDAAENDFVLNTFANAPGSGRVWLGLNDVASEGNFVYTNGDPFGYSNWDPGEPNNAGDEDFVLMYSGNGRWVDVMDLANPPGIGEVYGVIEIPTSAGPPNNQCDSATTISGYGLTPFDTSGSSSDGPLACGVLQNDVWFAYTACTSGVHTLTTCDQAGFDTALAAYAGSCGALAQVACNDDACGLRSTISWDAVAGTTYLLQVGGFLGASGAGNINLSGPSCCPEIGVVQGPIVNPANGHTYYRLSNSNWTCAEQAAVGLGGHLVSINDAVENDFVLNTFANAKGSGRVWLGLNDAASEGNFVYTNGDPFGYSNWEPGEPNDANNEDYVAMYSGNGRWVDVMDLANPPGIGEVYGVVEVPTIPGPANDQCASATAISGYGLTAFDNTGSTSDGPLACGVLQNDVWFTYTACTSGVHTLTTCDQAGFDTALAAYTGSCGALAQVACNDDTCGLRSTISWDATAGTTYVLQVGGFLGSSGAGNINLSGPVCCDPIAVVQGPIVNPANGHTYYRLSNSAWTCAEQFAVGLGGHLVSISDAAENDFVLNTFTNAPGSGRVWLGLNDAAVEGNFVYTNGDPLGFTNWEPGEPNDANNEDYVAMYSGNGRWVDVMDLANPPGIGEVYGVVEVPTQGPPCPCDFNNNNVLNSQDFFDFLACFFTNGCADADYNNDKVVNSQDFFDFLSCFFAPPKGC